MKHITRPFTGVVVYFFSFFILLMPLLLGAQKSEGIKNPLLIDSLEDFIIIILNLVIVLAIPIVVLFIILAGFKYVTARGNPAQIQEATQALTYAIIGGVLIIGATAIAGIIKDLVKAFF
jgi:TRAP-type C4-dicarboxylate transport system permease small subunit